MEKAYLAYEPTVVGDVCSRESASAAFSNSELVLGGVRGLNLFSKSSGNSVGSILAGGGVVSCVEANSNLKACGCTNGDLMVWNNSNKLLWRVTNAHSSATTCVKMRNDLMISGGNDALVKVWSLQTKMCEFVLKSHTHGVTDLTWASDRVIVSTSKDGSARWWNVDSGELLETRLDSKLPLYGAFVDQNVVFTVAADGKIRSYAPELESDEVVFASVSSSSSNKHDRVFSTANERFAAVAVGKKISVYELVEADVSANAAKRRKKRLAADKQRTLQKTTDRLKLRASIETPFRVTGVGLSVLKKKACLLVVSMGGANSAQTYKLSNAGLPALKYDLNAHVSPILSVDVSPNDQTLLSLSKHEMRVFRVNSKSLIRACDLSFMDAKACVAISHKLAFVCSVDKSVLLDLQTGDKLCEASVGGAFVSRASDSELLIGHSDCLKVIKIDNAAITLLKTVSMNGVEITATHSSDSRHLVATTNNSVKMFDSKTFELMATLYGHRLPVSSIDAVDDLVVTGSYDKNLRVWDAEFGDCRVSLLAHEHEITCVRLIKPNTHYAVSTASNGEVKMWDLDRFVLIARLQSSHVGSIKALKCLNSTGEAFITGGDDRALRFFDRTDEVVYPEEQRAAETERIDLAKQRAAEEADYLIEDDDDVANVINAPPPRAETFNAYDSLSSFLDLAMHDLESRETSTTNHKPNPLLMGKNGVEYFETQVLSMPLKTMRDGLSLLSFRQVPSVVFLLLKVLESETSSQFAKENAVRMSLFVVKNHFKALRACPDSKMRVFGGTSVGISEWKNAVQEHAKSSLLKVSTAIGAVEMRLAASGQIDD